MNSAWKNYDNWKLASPYDNDGQEYFVTLECDLYSCDEQSINEFNIDYSKAKKSNKTKDNLEEYKDYLIDKLNLHTRIKDALED